MLTRDESCGEVLPILGMIWLTALACFIWDAAMARYDIFPARLLKPSHKSNHYILEGTLGP